MKSQEGEEIVSGCERKNSESVEEDDSASIILIGKKQNIYVGSHGSGQIICGEENQSYSLPDLCKWRLAWVLTHENC